MARTVSIKKAKKSPLKSKAKLLKKTAKKTTKKPTKKPLKKAVKKSSKKLNFIPKGYNAITPYLIVHNANEAIEFYKKIFGAKETMRMPRPDGKVMHAELKFSDAKIMLADECPEMGAKSPNAFGGTAASINLYIKDVDTVVEKAVGAGAKIIKEVETMFYGDRSGSIIDPFGHKWHVSTHVEDVTMAQMKKRAAKMFAQS